MPIEKEALDKLVDLKSAYLQAKEACDKAKNIQDSAKKAYIDQGRVVATMFEVEGIQQFERGGNKFELQEVIENVSITSEKEAEDYQKGGKVKFFNKVFNARGVQSFISKLRGEGVPIPSFIMYKVKKYVRANRGHI